MSGNPPGRRRDTAGDALAGLLAACARGDEDALAQLYRALARTIRAFAMRRGMAAEQAEEIVVETMYEVWRHAGRFAGGSLVSSWVLGIARHKILDRVRRGGGIVVEELGDEAEAVADERPSAFDELVRRQQANQVAACLEALPDAQRECLHLVFYEELPLAEIAAIQECPENTVKTRLFHARRKMKDCLQRLFGRNGDHG
jgi:RNA polymerase sigma-70 factor (ECF subfamily)